MVEGTPSIIWVNDGQRQIRVNAAFCRYFGVEADDITGDRWKQLLHPDDVEAYLAEFEACVRDRRPLHTEVRARRADGAWRWLESRGHPCFDAKGDYDCFVGTCLDVTDRRERKGGREAADRQRDELLATLGHELRNPLSVVYNAAQLIQHRYPDDPELDRLQALLTRQVAHMSKLIDGLLDASRAALGKVELEFEPFDLRDVVRDVLNDLAERDRAARRRIATDLGAGPLPIRGDRTRMIQIVDNLVSNAIKYSENDASIRIRVERAGDRAVLHVDDDGIGIEPELLPHVFDAFRQSRHARHRAQGGLGLGLALVRSLVELHDGTIRAHSDGRGRGARMTVDLPVTEGMKMPLGVERGLVRSPLRVLVVEDNEDSAETLAQLLSATGYQAQVAHGGPEAVGIARRFEPDVVLCDLELAPGFTGFDVLRALRAAPETRRAVIVALTGLARAEDRAASQAAGFDAFLRKPVDHGVLDRILGASADDRPFDSNG